MLLCMVHGLPLQMSYVHCEASLFFFSVWLVFFLSSFAVGVTFLPGRSGLHLIMNGVWLPVAYLCLGCRQASAALEVWMFSFLQRLSMIGCCVCQCQLPNKFSFTKVCFDLSLFFLLFSVYIL
jgi:hypothetical protein